MVVYATCGSLSLSIWLRHSRISNHPLTPHPIRAYVSYNFKLNSTLCINEEPKRRTTYIEVAVSTIYAPTHVMRAHIRAIFLNGEYRRYSEAFRTRTSVRVRNTLLMFTHMLATTAIFGWDVRDWGHVLRVLCIKWFQLLAVEVNALSWADIIDEFVNGSDGVCWNWIEVRSAFAWWIVDEFLPK